MPGEWMKCKCGEIVDTEVYPEGFYLEEGVYICEECAEEAEHQRELAKEASRMRQAEINAIRRRGVVM